MLPSLGWGKERAGGHLGFCGGKSSSIYRDGGTGADMFKPADFDRS